MSMKQFQVGVKAVIVHDGKVLLLRKSAVEPFWELPGGRIDGNETIAETLARELQEELPNIRDFTMLDIVGAKRLEKEHVPELGLMLLFYKVTAEFDGNPQISDEHDAYKWADKDAALGLAGTVSRDAIAAALTEQPKMLHLS